MIKKAIAIFLSVLFCLCAVMPTVHAAAEPGLVVQESDAAKADTMQDSFSPERITNFLLFLLIWPFDQFCSIILIIREKLPDSLQAFLQTILNTVRHTIGWQSAVEA